MDSSQLEPIGGGGPQQPAPRRGANPLASIGLGVRRVLGVRFVGPIVALAAVAVIVGAAWVAGGPLDLPALDSSQAGRAPIAQPGADWGTGTSSGGTKELTPAVPETGGGTAVDGGGSGDNALIASLDAALIVRNGQVVLQVSDLDKAVSAADAAITGLGGYVSDSSRSGLDQYATASVTYRLPVEHWNDALKAVHGVGDKVLSEQTGSSDVTSQVIDIDARIANLEATEAALQAIMARATDIKDVLAVQVQLSQVQGDIESLTAQSKHLKDQAAMSTLSVTFQLPSETVTVQATNEWTLGEQVDQAIAALVRLGQGLATLAIWAVIVALPSLLGLLVLYAAWRLVRRLFRRASRPEQAAPTA